MKLTVIHFNGVLQRNIKHFHYVFIVQGIIYEDAKTLSIYYLTDIQIVLPHYYGESGTAYIHKTPNDFS